MLIVFLTSPFLLGYETCDQYEVVLSNPDQGCYHFPHNFWSSYEYLTHHQSEYSFVHYMVTHVSPVMLTIEPSMITVF